MTMRENDLEFKFICNACGDGDCHLISHFDPQAPIHFDLRSVKQLKLPTECPFESKTPTNWKDDDGT